MQKSLFEPDENSPLSKGKIIRIKQPGAALTKEQQSFNRLVKRIENLQRQLAEVAAKMEDLRKLYHEKITPSVMELSRLKIELCHLLDKKRATVKLTNIQNDKLNDLIIDFLDDALSVAEPDELTQQLYKKYNNETFCEAQQQGEEEAKDLFRDLFYKQFGLDIDPALLTDNPDFEKISESLKERLSEKEQKRKRNPKTTKKQEREVQEQELKNKTLRSIYLSLVKLLHPDTEPDETLKHEKQEMMKQVTTAYNNRDMMNLLQLEMQWVKTHGDELSKMNSSTITIYLQLLKDQVKDLEAEQEMMFFSPVYAQVAQYRYVTIIIAKDHICEEAGQFKNLNEAISNDIAALQKGNRNHAIIRDCINNYYSEPELPW